MGTYLTRPITVELPDTIIQALEVTARQQRRTVSEIVRELILQGQSHLPSLPEDVEAELAAFANLSDDVLWLLARSTLTLAEQQELAALNHEAQKRPLSSTESTRQTELLEAYERVLVRRAQAALLLKSRGYDTSDPHTLQ